MELHDCPTPYQASEPELPEPPRCGLEELAPPDVFDPVIEAYKKDVDRTLLRENLKLTPAQRAEKLQDFVNFLSEIQRAGRRLRGEAS
ncbi:MAG: hypothetical protein HY300_01380 [Verrucomicrobia bacterium]|nr:hypothetical protein [Verrucomicrobiota bacterium]